MGREVKRVPLDFDWPLNQVWRGYLLPDRLRELPCPACEHGYSAYAERLHARWYGYAPFDPQEAGSTPLTADTPAVRAFAERNVASAPEYYGVSEAAIRREAQRLAALFNGAWQHHLAQEDVGALAAANRLFDFTHRWTNGRWEKIEPLVTPTAAEVNAWSLLGWGHDSSNAYIVIKAKCEREGQPVTCHVCDGYARIEAYPGQRAEAEAWQPEEPPMGDGWQVWETVSEGSPVSPVFATKGKLLAWLRDAEYAPWAVTGLAEGGWIPSAIIGCSEEAQA